MRLRLTKAIAATALGSAVALPAAAQDTELRFLIFNTPDKVALADALEAAYEGRNPEIDVVIETRPGGGEGNNLVRTRLATDEMADLFIFNSGSLFQALNPDQTLVDMSGEAFADRIVEGYKSVVSTQNGLYGVPIETAHGGGVFYHVPTYERLGLELPRTWDEFMANNEAIAAAGDTVPVAQTFRDAWTSQILFLADYHNVEAEMPSFAADFTNAEIRFAETPVAMRGFEKLDEVAEAGYLNEDFGAAGLEDGLRMVATGQAAHYPMLTFAIGALSANHPEELSDVGFFALPGDDASTNGLTVWMPAAIYVPQSSENVEEAMAFLDFVASEEGCGVMLDALGVTGPFMIEGCEISGEIPRPVSDLLTYFESEETYTPALEFLTPVKGPSLEQITVEVGTDIREPLAAAEMYDSDVRRQARQLGLPNW